MKSILRIGKGVKIRRARVNEIREVAHYRLLVVQQMISI
jgi:hypothetical protein